MLVRSGWQKEQVSLLAPFCGSGTILIEAAMMACDIAPGLHRERFGFEHWLRHPDHGGSPVWLLAEQASFFDNRIQR